MLPETKTFYILEESNADGHGEYTSLENAIEGIKEIEKDRSLKRSTDWIENYVVVEVIKSVAITTKPIVDIELTVKDF